MLSTRQKLMEATIRLARVRRVLGKELWKVDVILAELLDDEDRAYEFARALEKGEPGWFREQREQAQKAARLDTESKSLRETGTPPTTESVLEQARVVREEQRSMLTGSTTATERERPQGPLPCT